MSDFVSRPVELTHLVDCNGLSAPALACSKKIVQSIRQAAHLKAVADHRFWNLGGLPSPPQTEAKILNDFLAVLKRPPLHSPAETVF
ncbi:MAG: hypothetical protein LBT47_04720 [Deltaproteobacteria bacterium]|nr:hypothetical protein [Deltaproteobacteria bacterium]